ncbi:MAG TPA: diacylglycerol kinase family lipid kinase [Vicinamibacterales bacterium]|nr:diacylglycerol kinase family lipid kinase [Vicinamibacterales bacterium]
MDSCLIVNPVSGSDRAPEFLPAIEERLRSTFGGLDVKVTSHEGDAEDTARQAAETGCRRVVVAGGDGTLNEALNGIASAGALDRVAIGLLPLGTGNDFAGTLGLHDDPLAAAEVVASGRERRVDVGVVNGRVFVNASAGGFLAEVSDALTPGMKTIAGRLAYLLAGAGVIASFDPPSAAVTIGGESLGARQYQLFVVCNGPTIGGGHRAAPRARPDDGLLDACLVEASGTLDLVALLRRLSKGEHLDAEGVTYRQFQSAELAFDRVLKVNTDGEVIETRICRYRVLPGAARFIA